MNQQQIESIFNELLHKHGALSKIAWITKDVTYAWRKGITTPTIGDMLGVLFELNLIKVFKNESTSK